MAGRTTLDLPCSDCGVVFQTKGHSSYRCSTCKTEYKRRKEYNDPEGRMKALCKVSLQRARRGNFPHDLTPEFLMTLWDEFDGCCSLTGMEFDLTNYGDKYQRSPQTPSIDKIDPKRGYVQGNVRLVTWHMNAALSEYGTEEFERLAKAYLNGEV